jgi:anti-sigma factor RsiW
MSCSPFDLKDYFFGELGEAECARVRSHIQDCRVCSEELERLRQTEAALRLLREEEPPRRIAFVSDPVFRPRWWQVWWNSAARLGFASAAMLAAAILVHAFAARPMVVMAPRPAVVAASRIDATAIDSAVRAAVAESEARQARKTAELVESARRDIREVEFERRVDRVRFEETLTLLQKRYNGLLLASAEFGGRP